MVQSSLASRQSIPECIKNKIFGKSEDPDNNLRRKFELKNIGRSLSNERLSVFKILLITIGKSIYSQIFNSNKIKRNDCFEQIYKHDSLFYGVLSLDEIELFKVRANERAIQDFYMNGINKRRIKTYKCYLIKNIK